MAERSPRRRRARDALLARLAEIRDAGDRGRSFELLDLLLRGGLDDDRIAQVADAMVALEDPRSAPALLQAVHDTNRSFVERVAAIEILSATPYDDPPRESVCAWARSHDPLVRALGVQYLDVPEADLIAAAAADPEAVVRRVAVEAMASLVRTPTLVAALRRALRDEDAFVREAACRVALFDEPLEASWDLLRTLNDPSNAVQSAAYDALEWFPRVSVLLALADARSSAEDAGPAEATLGILVARVLAAVARASTGARRRIERWAGPATWLLDPAPRRAPPEREARASPPRRASMRKVDVEFAERALSNQDSPPSIQREMLARRSWARCGKRGVDVLRACATSTNWSLRQLSARPLAEAGALDQVVALAFDREPVVRRAAFVAALELTDTGGAALVDAAREALRDPWMRPTAGDHAIAVVAAHGGMAAVEETVLAELGRPDDRDGLYLGAIHLARLAGIRAAIPALLSVVNAPVVAGVGPHVAALQTLRGLGHPRGRIDLRHLDGVDHLDVQCELGEWGWHGRRFG